jgi:hypothetical protein
MEFATILITSSLCHNHKDKEHKTQCVTLSFPFRHDIQMGNEIASTQAKTPGNLHPNTLDMIYFINLEQVLGKHSLHSHMLGGNRSRSPLLSRRF